jgi:glycosyltransferase involved in cell wall biosynthesis
MTFGDTSPGAFLCVYVGRISKEKRLDVIVEAVKNIPGAYLAIIGDGPSAAMYAATHGKESRIYCKPRFLSHVELAEIYASSDLHVSASQFETLGNTVLEAFACGIPVVVPRCQGFCDTVIDDKDGFLFEPGNSSSAQGYIEVLKNDPVKRAAMGEHGRVVVLRSREKALLGTLSSCSAPS